VEVGLMTTMIIIMVKMIMITKMMIVIMMRMARVGLPRRPPRRMPC
jgi:hypothetical protein